MKQTQDKGIAIFWFRRDLRLEDNVALYHALQSSHQVFPIFIFDTTILDQLNDSGDRRVTFIYQETRRIKSELEDKYGSTLHVFCGTSEKIFAQLAKLYHPASVYANEDYEPYAVERDKHISTLLGKVDIPFYLFKDHAVFAKNEIVKSDGKPYTVFTPYSKQWLAYLTEESIKSVDIKRYTENFYKCTPASMMTMSELGFHPDDTFDWPPRVASLALLKKYSEVRDIPSTDGTSHLGIHLRFGTISIRQLVRQTKEASTVFLSELIWREFFLQIIWHFPHVVTSCFKPKYEAILWRNDETEFDAWCHGNTGYPMVDAGMRELNATGFMHNRVRMVVASFLTKHLLIDWRWGEAYFAEKLLDYELASNNGNWQWAAGTGCDAAPYFRIFNPSEQARKFDPKGEYIRKWIPELETSKYPFAIVDHQMARARALKTYREALV